MLTIHHANRREFAVATGWLAKAERLLDDEPPCFAHGHLAIVRTLFSEVAGDWPAVLEGARQAQTIGIRCDDPDLQALGLAFHGLALVQQGEVSDGMRLLDEAMASAVGGELSPMPTGIIHCRMLCAALDLQEFGRAAEWTAVIDSCAAKSGLGGLPGDCATHRAEVLLMRGRWDEGSEEALRGLEESAQLELSHVGVASRGLGEIRLRLGDLEGAEEAFLRADEYGVRPERGIALLRLERDQVAAAVSGLESALAAIGNSRLARARLLPVCAQAALTAGDTDAATDFVAELEDTAETYGTLALAAAAEQARGALELAGTRPQRAANR